MKAFLSTSLMMVVLGSIPVLAQRAGRQAPKVKPPKPSPVDVTRSAALRISIASDTVGIFNFLSDSQKLTQWFPDQAVIEPALGGKYHFKWNDKDGVWSGVVTEFIRGNTLGFTWRSPDDPDETNVRFKLFPQGSQTILELTHSNFRSADTLDKAVKDWTFYLENLKSVIEEGTDMRAKQRKETSRPASRTRRRR